jgi:hypothetical protein
MLETRAHAVLRCQQKLPTWQRDSQNGGKDGQRVVRLATGSMRAHAVALWQATVTACCLHPLPRASQPRLLQAELHTRGAVLTAVLT